MGQKTRSVGQFRVTFQPKCGAGGRLKTEHPKKILALRAFTKFDFFSTCRSAKNTKVAGGGRKTRSENAEKKSFFGRKNWRFPRFSARAPTRHRSDTSWTFHRHWSDINTESPHCTRRSLRPRLASLRMNASRRTGRPGLHVAAPAWLG